MVIGLLEIYSDDVCQWCLLGKNPEENFDEGKALRTSSSIELVHDDITIPFPHPSESMAKYALDFIDD